MNPSQFKGRLELKLFSLVKDAEKLLEGDNPTMSVSALKKEAYC